MTACIRKIVRYLDIGTELDGYKIAIENDREVRDAVTMLLLGCEGGVVMLDCFAGKDIEQVKNPANIDISLCISGPISRGSAIGASRNMCAKSLQRVNGELVKQETTNISQLDFDNGQGSVRSYPTTLPNIITILKSTQVSNSLTFVHDAGDALPAGDLASLPDDPPWE
jgi:short subunit dehydrogenase-like uncharacterized protein